MKRLAVVLFLFCFVEASVLRAATTLTDLRCEHLTNPEGIDVAKPRLSWILESKARGQRQTAYQVLVASSEKNLAAGKGDLWDSGKVASDQSIEVNYGGTALVSTESCFWKVRVWDVAGKASAWSAGAHWSMGLLAAADWQGKWIGLDGEDVTNYLAGTSWVWSSAEAATSAMPATNYFRKVITIPAGRQIQRAFFQYTGDNDCRGSINDLDLGVRNNYRTVKYNDITTRIEVGKTYAFCLIGHTTHEKKPAGVVGLLQIEFTSGEPMVVATDESWKMTDHEVAGWNTPGFDDSGWATAKVLGPVEMQPWGEVRRGDDHRLAARMLRKEFPVEKKIARATVYFSGLGLSELYINGKKADDRVLSPGVTEYPKRVFYETLDVTKQLRMGANALGVILGNGRFYAMRNSVYSGMPTYGFPKLLLQLRIEYTDGSVSNVVSDGSWKLTTDGPIVANNEYDGEEYDARKELSGWSAAGFDDAKWQEAQVVAKPAGAVTAQMIDPMRVTQVVKPVSVTEIKPGVFVYDMGQNMVGWCRLTVQGAAGTDVLLRHAETLNADGSLYFANIRGARVTDIYTLKGGGVEVYEPRFTYHGFRYVEVTGFPGKPTLAAIEGCVVHDDLRVAGEFESSNPLLNKIYQNVVWGTQGNYRSIPTDCPQRDERQGWLGDRSEESRGEMYLFDNDAFYAKWTRDIADAQRESGSVPDVAPTYWPIFNDDVTWPSSGLIIPNSLHRQFGDVTAVAEHYDSAKRWVDYMLGFVTNGILARDQYGDWCVPPNDPKEIHTTDPARLTGKEVLATTYFYYDLKLMERYATLLGKTGEAAHYAKLAEAMKKAFNDQYLDRSKGQYDNGTQTSSVLPLMFGMVPEDVRDKVFNHLADQIDNESHGHIGTGLIGGQFLNRVLSDNGRADLAYTIATQTNYPGWGYMVAQGATTVWELWNGNTADPSMNSGNHVMLVGDLVTWLYEYLGGIAPDDAQPGFKHIVMRPQPVGDLKYVKATHRSPYGLIASEWHDDGKTFDWQIEVPVNTTATVYIRTARADSVYEGKGKALAAKGVTYVGIEHGCAVFTVGSGKYHFWR